MALHQALVRRWSGGLFPALRAVQHGGQHHGIASRDAGYCGSGVQRRLLLGGPRRLPALCRIGYGRQLRSVLPA
ncbi:hypothetical protein G6F57_017187 [Rhizopus arrhizus]|nr:hypothetical protein G6F35_018142 [Rhizopus arrhizus]KAG1234730.1 hypothetical protein G6F68_018964 [Rhizopus microsporus]KAG1446951.1 hypothetical protein G6F57_017187 [Rhizopus arrhizus]